MLKDFKEFIERGNLLHLAVAFIMGVAFAAVVTSLVNDIIMPPSVTRSAVWTSPACSPSSKRATRWARTTPWPKPKRPGP